MKDLKTGDFIKIYDVFTRAFCDNAINKFEESETKHIGLTCDGYFDYKKSTDDGIDPTSEHWKDTDTVLYEKLSEYVTRYFKEISPEHPIALDNIEDSGYLIRRYDKGSGKFEGHCDACTFKTAKRLVGIIIYLNDVENGGETEFFLQGLMCKPKAGQVVMFPASFIYQHQGHIPISEHKYIITSFIQFKEISPS